MLQTLLRYFQNIVKKFYIKIWEMFRKLLRQSVLNYSSISKQLFKQ